MRGRLVLAGVAVLAAAVLIAPAAAYACACSPDPSPLNTQNTDNTARIGNIAQDRGSSAAAQLSMASQTETGEPSTNARRAPDKAAERTWVGWSTSLVPPLLVIGVALVLVGAIRRRRHKTKERH